MRRSFPKRVDVTLVEGAVSIQDDLEKLHTIRAAQQARGGAGRLRRDRQRAGHAQHDPGAQASGAHLRRGRAGTAGHPGEGVPALLRRPSPSTKWSRWTCTCPAARRSATAILCVLAELLEGRIPDLASTVKFG